MKFYVANVTKQHYVFTYRVPERAQPCTQLIPVGEQICLAPNGSDTDLSQLEIDMILKQYEKYGIADVNGIDHAKGPFNGICYSIGKPISVEKMRKAMLKSDQVLDKLGKQIRQEAAVAAHSDFENRFLAGDPMQKHMDISVEEVIPSRGLDDDLTHISEGVRITRNPTSDLPILDIRRR